MLPLHPELVQLLLREWLPRLKPTEKLFPDLDKKKTWKMVKRDLARAGIPYETEEGIADFHPAGRHTYITELLRNGATLPEAEEFARHTGVNITMRYTHNGLEDRSKALANLKVPAPALQKNPEVKPETAETSGDNTLQMPRIWYSARSPSETLADIGDSEDINITPGQCQGHVAACLPEETGGNVKATGCQLNL